MATQNNFKSTSISGIFTNSDYPDGSILANGTFNRDLYVKGDLYLGKETGTTGAYIDTGANINFTIGGVVYTLTPAILQILITLSSQSLATQTYVNNQISALVASSPATLDTLKELATALGNDPNFATTTATNISTKASLTNNQTISGINTLSNIGNNYYGNGSNLKNINATNTKISTSSLGINQVVPLINTQSAIEGNYQFNIGVNINNNILFNNDTGALTVNKYYGDGSSLTGLTAGISLTSLGINQMVPLINTQTSTAGNYYLSIGVSNNILFNNDTGALTVNKYYGDGSNLTNINATRTKISVTSLGVNQMVPLINTQTATAGIYDLNIGVSNILFNNNTGALTVNKYYGDGSNLTNVNYTLPTNLMKTDVVQSISAVNTFSNPNNIFYGSGANLTGLTLPTNLMKTDATQTISGTNTFSTVPICATNCTTSSQLANKAYVDSVIPSLTNYVDKSSLQTITGAKLFNSLAINNTDNTHKISFMANSGGGSYNAISQAGDNLIFAGGAVNAQSLTLTTWSNTKCGIRITPSVITVDGSTTFSSVPICSIAPTTTSHLTNKAYVDSVIPSLTNYVDLSSTQTITGLKTFNNTSNSFTGSVFQSGTSTFQHVALNTKIINTTNNGQINMYCNTSAGVQTNPLSMSASALSVYVGLTSTNRITLNSTDPASRMIFNTFYNLIDNSASTGIEKGRLYTTSNTCYLELYGATHTFSLIVSSSNVLQADITGVQNNKYNFGRNDGATFNNISLTGLAANLYPIGYCWEILGGVTKPVTLTDLTDNATIALGRGVWAISGYIVLNKGNGTFTTATNVSALWTVNIAGIKIYPNSSGVRVAIASTSTTTQHIIPIGTVNLVVTTANAIQTITRQVTMTVGTTTSWQISFTGVKIA